MQIFYENLKFIEDWNSQPDRHHVAMNHFGDWSHEEFLETIMPK